MIGGQALAPSPDGTFSFRPGRFYRLLCVVNGPTYLEDVEALLYALGFAPLVSSDPSAWDHERPPDWPDERPLPFVAVNEALVRISAGTGAARFPIHVERDAPIRDAMGNAPARLSVARAWDFGQAPPVDAIAGAAPPAARPAKSGNGSAALLAAGGLAAVGLWHYVAERRRLKRDEQRLHTAEAKAEREQVAGEVHRLIGAGHAPGRARTPRLDVGTRGELATDEELELVLVSASTEER